MAGDISQGYRSRKRDRIKLVEVDRYCLALYRVIRQVMTYELKVAFARCRFKATFGNLLVETCKSVCQISNDNKNNRPFFLEAKMVQIDR